MGRRLSIDWAVSALALLLIVSGAQVHSFLLGANTSGLAKVNEAVADDLSSGPQYVEQLGETFQQDSAYLSVNVTAIPQNDTDGYGPAYLLNGLTDQGWWYQVGLSYDWPHSGGGSYGGFFFNYEVFSATDQSVFPSPNSTSLSYFLGAVYAGDSVQLSLSFASGNVSMGAYDWQTHAVANASYSAEGSTSFVGMSQPSNQLGFFTGLMTEWYHASPYHGGEQQVTYSLQAPMGSAVLWVDEYDNLGGRTTLFSDSDSVTLSPLSLQNFTYQNASVASTSSSFTTGTIALSLLGLDLIVAQESVLPYLPEIPQTYQVNLTLGFQVNLVGGFPPYSYESYFDGKLVGNGTLTGPPAPAFMYVPNLQLDITSVNPGNHTYYFVFDDAQGLSKSSDVGTVEAVYPSEYQNVCQPSPVITGGFVLVGPPNETSGNSNVTRIIGGYFEGISSLLNNELVTVGCSLHATIPPNSTGSQYVGEGFWFDPSSSTFAFHPGAYSISTLVSGLVSLYEVLAIAMLGPAILLGYRLVGRGRKNTAQ